MSIPLFALLGFALWTHMILFLFVGPYRWISLLSGRTRASYWTADPNAGSGFYPRAMRAHMNCIENLPVFAVIVYVIERIGLQGQLIDSLVLMVLGGRILQSLVHVIFEQTDKVIFVRFGFFFTQIVAMLVLVYLILTSL